MYVYKTWRRILQGKWKWICCWEWMAFEFRNVEKNFWLSIFLCTFVCVGRFRWTTCYGWWTCWRCELWHIVCEGRSWRLHQSVVFLWLDKNTHRDWDRDSINVPSLESCKNIIWQINCNWWWFINYNLFLVFSMRLQWLILKNNQNFVKIKTIEKTVLQSPFSTILNSLRRSDLMQFQTSLYVQI